MLIESKMDHSVIPVEQQLTIGKIRDMEKLQALVWNGWYLEDPHKCSSHIAQKTQSYQIEQVAQKSKFQYLIYLQITFLPTG